MCLIWKKRWRFSYLAKAIRGVILQVICVCVRDGGGKVCDCATGAKAIDAQ